MQERERQNVSTPVTYSVALNDNDIRINKIVDKEDNDEQTSCFKLLQTLLEDWWKSSNSAEHHLKPIRRKVAQMLSKCIWSMKIIRLIFQLLGDNLNKIDQKQGDRTVNNFTCIDAVFQYGIQTSIESFLSDQCHQIDNTKYAMWSDKNDIIIGYN